MTDRRRINPPSGGTAPPVFASTLPVQRPRRTRDANEPRKMYLQTNLIPSAQGSAYLELASSTSPTTSTRTLPPGLSTLKLAVAVHFPRPLPRSAPFSPSAHLACTVTFAPFSTRRRRPFRDAADRDLGAHLETALRGAVIGERWPKAGVEVCVTVLEGEEDEWWGVDQYIDKGAAGGREESAVGGTSSLVVLSACVTAAAAALADARLDCVDLASGGVAAVVRDGDEDGESRVVLDPCPAEHARIEAACVVAYLAARDEITAVWMKGNGETSVGAEALVDKAVEAAVATRGVLVGAVKESVDRKLGLEGIESVGKGKSGKGDVEMIG